MLKPGAKAPDEEVVTHTGYRGPLSHFWQDGPLILFFYPKDNTSICTKQARELEGFFAEMAPIPDQLSSIMADLREISLANLSAKSKVNLLGSSTGSAVSHCNFAAKYNLQYPLVVDEGGCLAKAYRAFRLLLRVSKRITYIIDREGTIMGRIHEEWDISAHLVTIAKTLQKCTRNR